jgi:hypothetical protein
MEILVSTVRQVLPDLAQYRSGNKL